MPHMSRLLILWIGSVFLLTACVSEAAIDKGVRLTPKEDRIRVEVNGRLFTEYIFKDIPRPYFYPLMGPGDVAMTRKWPMESPPGEDHDHPHHRSLWFAHGLVNGIDFWSEQKTFGKIVADGKPETSMDGNTGVIRSKNQWVGPKGNIVCTDERVFRVYAGDKADEQMFDFEITLRAPDADVVFGDTKEGTMAIRVAESMNLKNHPGHIVNSEGQRDDATWGKRAKWCDYYGPIDGKIVGIAMFDHPDNPRYPTWWHVRDYGLFAANPFGQHDFETLDNKSAGDFKIAAGKSATFKYRFLLHRGNEKEAKVDARYGDYVKKR